MREVIVDGLKSGKTLCILNTRANREFLEIMNELESTGKVSVEFENNIEEQFSQYKVRWKESTIEESE